VRVDDIKAWERKHGRVPRGAGVLMWSGWEKRASDQTAYQRRNSW
jgi:kynurenine formamidase